VQKTVEEMQRSYYLADASEAGYNGERIELAERVYQHQCKAAGKESGPRSN
jgi:hypothetical protein